MDLNKIKKRLKALDRQSSGGSSNFWRPDPGKQVIRLLPYEHSPDFPFLELQFYYDLTNRTIISPLSVGEPDPIQEKADELKSTGEKEDWLLARRIEPKMRTYVPILVRGKEDEGVKFWGFGKTVYESILKTIDDPDWGDITDLKDGRDVVVEYEVPDNDGGFPKTYIRIKPNTSPASTNKEVIKNLKPMPTVEELWEVPTYQELEDLFEKYMNNESTEDDDEDTNTNMKSDLPFDVEENGSNNSDKKEQKAAATSDIDEAFDDMFG